jgi:hypothetical protein
MSQNDTNKIFIASIKTFLKPVEQYIDDGSVTEIMINGPDEVFIERKGMIEKTDARFENDTAVQALGANIPSIWNENVTACGVNATACKAIRSILAGHKFLDAGDTIRTADAPVGTAVCSGGCVQLGILNNIAGGTHCP